MMDGMWRKLKNWISNRSIRKKEAKENYFEKQLNRKISRELEVWKRRRRFTESGATIKSVAQEFNVSQEEMAYYFKSQKGTTFATWRKGVRIEYAKTLLLHKPELSISEIGKRCGIPDRSDFRRQFLEETGKYPLDWQKEYLSSR